jgi:NADPH-dependent ferric siderophore reductase
LVDDQEVYPVAHVLDATGMEMRMARFGKENRRQMMSLTVVRRTRMSEHLVRVTIGGDALDGFSYKGGDQCFRLFFPRPGQTELRMPTFANNGWAAQYFLMSKDVRPYVRNYTVRAFHPESNELDVDFVVHGDGPASVWAQQAEPGSPVGMFDEGRRYRPREEAEWQLLVADGSGLPAAFAIAEETPPSLPTRLIVEVPTPDDVLGTTFGPHVSATWLASSDGDGEVPGELARGAALATPPPSSPGTVFVAGENSLATGTRRGLVAAGVPKSAISFYGYWKVGRSSPS